MLDDNLNDDLALPEVGQWGRRKYHFLGRYLSMFTRAMRPKWEQLHFIDLFAGSGLAKIRETGAIVKTSSLIAGSLEVPFDAIHSCDASQANIDALRSRATRLGIQNIHATKGDANERVRHIVDRIPTQGTLCVTFADPFGLHLDFESVECVAKRRSDLIILFADNMDALRNWAAYYDNNPTSNLDRFMGEPGWRDLLRETKGDQQAQKLRSRYNARLRELGYEHFGDYRIENSEERPIYSLLYASRNPLGQKFWEEATSIDEQGQRSLRY
ncbi:MAG: three-Cys-motif partner protein TcmP [Phycisphaerales bacterium]|nr:three-Cys-motif partner protein TcmP [Phycisphaerales bacterium]